MLCVVQRAVQVLQVLPEALAVVPRGRGGPLGVTQSRVPLHKQPAQSVMLPPHALQVLRERVALLQSAPELALRRLRPLLAALQLPRRLLELQPGTRCQLSCSASCHASMHLPRLWLAAHACMHACTCTHKQQSHTSSACTAARPDEVCTHTAGTAETGGARQGDGRT